MADHSPSPEGRAGMRGRKHSRSDGPMNKQREATCDALRHLPRFLPLTIALCIAAGGPIVSLLPAAEPRAATAEEVLAGLRKFFVRTARTDGSFANGLDPRYRGMSDSAYSDLAAVTYAVTLHKTFGWKLPHEEATRRFLLSRQRPNGDFFNVAGTVDPASAEGRVYNTTQGIVALRALGTKPRHDPLRVFEEILQQDYKTLPAYSTSFFPLAYLCYGKPIPREADRRIRATMIQGDD